MYMRKKASERRQCLIDRTAYAAGRVSLAALPKQRVLGGKHGVLVPHAIARTQEYRGNHEGQ
jgi:hypothetical protein